MINTQVNSTWISPALDVLVRACDYYGGVENWESIQSIRLIPGDFSGFLPWIKGAGKTFQLPSAFEINPHKRRTLFHDYPDKKHIGKFENGTIRIERIDSGEVITEEAQYRQNIYSPFSNRRWNALDALYFFGYSLSHYHSLPFTLFQTRLLGFKSTILNNSPLDILDVEFPEDVPTHCRRQTFYFDTLGRLTRHDYHAEIAGCWARGAHFWNQEKRIRGFPIAFERIVVARLGRFPLPLTALRATFLDVEVQ